MAQLKSLIVNGASRFIGDVFANTFTGNLSGNADTATSATNAGNADTLDNLHIHTGRNNEANKIVRTDGNGYLQVGYINSSNGNEGNNASPARVWGTNGSDNYMRTYLTSALNVGSASYATYLGTSSANYTYSTLNTVLAGKANSSHSHSEYALTTAIPTKTSQLTNNSGFLTSHQDLSNYALKSEIPSVGSIASYNVSFLTQSAYNALSNKDSNTIYYIKE